MNKKRVALIAHDHKKQELVDWLLYNDVLIFFWDPCTRFLVTRISRHS